MKGGWRWGAGRPRSTHYGNVEQYRSIDIRNLARKKLLKPNNLLTWSWTTNFSDDSGSVSILVNSANQITFQYRLRNIETDEHEDISFPVSLSYSSCNYGGKRPWFICPHCGRRVAKLYYGSKGFYCRHTLRLAYSSQSECLRDRLHRKIGKIEAILEGRTHRKRLHNKTIDKLINEMNHYEMALDGMLYAKMTEWDVTSHP